MTQTAIKRVVVGVDGSDNSAAALEWAIQFAHLTGAEIVAVFAISPTSAVEYVGPTAFGPFPAVPPRAGSSLAFGGDSGVRAGVVPQAPRFQGSSPDDR